jgi:FMN phosphatase YigB (HAD superfamily)
MIVLFDIDNTLSDMDHRLHLIEKDDPDYEAFEKQCVNDPLIAPTAEVLIAFQNLKHQIWLWTGRSDAVETQTRQWLQRHALPYNQLLMRPYGDKRPTEAIKKQWLNNAPVPKDRVLCCFDDDPQIVEMLREQGMMVYQVRRPK